jgi:uncharacterized membrane protein
MTRTLLVFTVLCGFALGASAQDGPMGGPINTHCPLLPDEVIDPAFTVEVEGVKIGLCCRMCKNDFLAEPEKYLPDVPGFEEARAAALAGAAVGVTTLLPGGGPSSPADEGKATRDESLAGFAGRFHVVVVHFPIALVLAAALAELLGGRKPGPTLAGGRAWCLGLGALSAVVAAGLGWLRAESQATLPGLEDTLLWHRWLGVAAAALSVVALVASLVGAARKVRLVCLLLAAVVVGVAGHYGAQLVYGTAYFG